jgi:hypothetical protein
MDIDLTDKEIDNLILSMIDQIQKNLPFPENGVELNFLASNLNMEAGEVKKYIQKLKLKKAVSWHSERTRGQFFVNPTDKTLNYLERLNSLTIRETAKLILEKSYDFYKRASYDSSLQLNSTTIGNVLGFNNIPKINSAIEMLEDEGFIKNPAFMLGNTIYFLSAKGINMIENKTEKQTVNSSPIIINNESGNVAINSNNIKQNINTNRLDGYFELLEKLISENLQNKEKADAMADLEMVKELSNVENPKKHLIQRMLDNLDKIPILIEIVNKIREYFN